MPDVEPAIWRETADSLRPLDDPFYHDTILASEHSEPVQEARRFNAVGTSHVRPPPPPIASRGDRQIVALWVANSSSPDTRRHYQRQANRFVAFIDRPLSQVGLDDVLAYAATIECAPATRANAVAAVKSLLSFGRSTGLLPSHCGKVLPFQDAAPTPTIASRPDVFRMVALEPKIRNRALLALLYEGGLRARELCGLHWRDLTATTDAGQVTISGSGGTTRIVPLSAETWSLVQYLSPLGSLSDREPVFRSRLGGHCDRSMVHRVVKAAAARAGLSTEMATRWLRHAHASHAARRMSETGCSRSSVR